MPALVAVNATANQAVLSNEPGIQASATKTVGVDVGKLDPSVSARKGSKAVGNLESGRRGSFVRRIAVEKVIGEFWA